MQILKYIFIGLLIFLTCGCGGKKKQGEFRYFRNYQRTFNDLNDKHLKAARQWGIQPVTSDEFSGCNIHVVAFLGCYVWQM